jgi:hypothetical protein
MSNEHERHFGIHIAPHNLNLIFNLNLMQMHSMIPILNNVCVLCVYVCV